MASNVFWKLPNYFPLIFDLVKKAKVKQSLYGPGQALRVLGGWGAQISWQQAHKGGQVARPTHRPPLTSQEIFLVLISLRCQVDGRAIGNRTRNRPACSAVRQPTGPQRVSSSLVQTHWHETMQTNDIRMHGRAVRCYGLLQEQHVILQFVVKLGCEYLALLMESEKRSAVGWQRNPNTRLPYVETTAHRIKPVTSLQWSYSFANFKVHIEYS
jgi:hypothetical protein